MLSNPSFSLRSPSKGPNTENALFKRVRFGARIVTKNGRDAHRELNGFFFSTDGTLTLYEFHQFGTRLIFAWIFHLYLSIKQMVLTYWYFCFDFLITKVKILIIVS